MGLNIKNSVIGVDIPIQNFQKFLYTQLLAKWKVSEAAFLSYGRCYRNNAELGCIPEVYVSGSVAQYVGIEFDDSNTIVLSFFDLYDDVKFSNGSTTARADLIFIVNVTKLKPDIAHRADEEIRNDVERLSQVPRFGFIATDFQTGYNNVFSRFQGIVKNDQITWRDLQPLHVFKITFDFVYNINDCA